MKKHLSLCVAGALAASLACAQDQPPQPPPPPAAPPTATPAPPGPPRGFPAPDRGPDRSPQRGPDRGPRDEGQRGPREEAPRGPRREGGPRENQPAPGGDQQQQQRPGMRGPGGFQGERNWPGRPGGPGGPGGAGAGAWGEQMAPAQPQAFLGVMTLPLPEPLSAQLSVPAGFGLLVAGVMPGSPAAQAGIKKFDVLRYFDDQQLAEPGQLAALVRAAGKDKEVSVTVIRQAKEQKLSVKIGEHMMPAEPRFPMFRRMMEDHQERTRDLQDRAREMREQMQKRFHEHKDDHGERPGPGSGPGAAIAPEEILRQAHPNGGSRIQVSTDSSVTTMEGARSRFHLSDNDGEIEVDGQNGHRVLTARDRDGKTIFTGPVDTTEQRAAIPPPLREKLEKIHLRPGAPNAFERSGPRDGQSSPEAAQRPPLDVQ